jgi:hypothetical protein
MLLADLANLRAHNERPRRQASSSPGACRRRWVRRSSAPAASAGPTTPGSCAAKSVIRTAMTGLHEQLQERIEEVEAARAANRELGRGQPSVRWSAADPLTEANAPSMSTYQFAARSSLTDLETTK